VRRRELEIEEATGLCDVGSPEDLGLTSGRCRSLGHPSFGGLHGHQVHAVELIADVTPGVAGPALDRPHEQQAEPAELPAQLDVAPDPVLAMVEDRSEPEGPEPPWKPWRLWPGRGTTSTPREEAHATGDRAAVRFPAEVPA
jgi:hypothetical protein